MDINNLPSRGIYEAYLMDLIYPAQRRSFKEATDAYLCSTRQQFPFIKDLVVMQGTLEKDGVGYYALIAGKQSALKNGNWVLQATGNMQPVETACLNAARIYAKAGFNTLLVNGPGVGCSEGCAMPKTIGEAQETGLRFLETAIRANNIAIAGHSLGGAAIGQAILQHKFHKKINYLVIRQHTFDRLSNAAEKIVTRFARVLFPSSLEMDNIAASIKLQKLAIREVIIQAANKEVDPSQMPQLEDFKTDGIIPPEASLAYRLIKDGITKDKVFHCIKDADHNDAPTFYDVTVQEIQKHF